LTFLREGTVAVEHVFRRRKRRYSSGVESVARFIFGIVDSHEDSASNAGSVRMDRSGAKHCGDGGVDGIATLNQNVPIIFFFFFFFCKWDIDDAILCLDS
jgi:hypothetical protein